MGQRFKKELRKIWKQITIGLAYISSSIITVGMRLSNQQTDLNVPRNILPHANEVVRR